MYKHYILGIYLWKSTTLKGDFVQFSYRHDHATKLVGSIINILTNTIVVDIGNNEDLSHIEPRQVVRINNCKSNDGLIHNRSISMS